MHPLVRIIYRIKAKKLFVRLPKRSILSQDFLAEWPRFRIFRPVIFVVHLAAYGTFLPADGGLKSTLFSHRILHKHKGISCCPCGSSNRRTADLNRKACGELPSYAQPAGKRLQIQRAAIQVDTGSPEGHCIFPGHLRQRWQ